MTFKNTAYESTFVKYTPKNAKNSYALCVVTSTIHTVVSWSMKANDLLTHDNVLHNNCHLLFFYKGNTSAQ